MNKKILKILIATLILLIGIGAVNALDDDCADDVVSSDQNDDVVEISEEQSETLAEENNAVDVVEASEEQKISAAEEDSDVIGVNENQGEILTAKICEDDKLSSTESGSDSQSVDYITTHTQYKTFTLGKFSVLKKYKKYLYKDDNQIPKKILKLFNKKIKKVGKQVTKVAKKLIKKHWQQYAKKIKISIKNKGKYVVVSFKLKHYRSYELNHATNKITWLT